MPTLGESVSVRRRHRRSFLQTAFAGSLGGLLGVCGSTILGSGVSQAADDLEPQSSAKPGAAVDFCFSLYGMRMLKLSEALRTCANLGYDGVELVATAGWPCDPQNFSRKARRELRQQLQDAGLKVPSLMEHLTAVVDEAQHTKNLDRLRAAGELAHDVSPHSPPVIETVLGGRTDQWESLRNRMVKALADWARVAERSQVTVAIKAHIGGALHRSEDARWLVDQVDHPRIRLNYDYSHFQLQGELLDRSLKQMIPKTVFIHVKDSRGTVQDGFRFALPGEGTIDYRNYFHQLKRQHYRGPLTVEVSGHLHTQADYDPHQAAQRSYRNLSSLLAESGLRGEGKS